MSNDIIPTDGTPFLLYEGENESVHVKVLMQAETIWLTQRALGELFQTSKQNISLHLQNIFEEGELAPDATVKEFLTVQTEGKREVQRSLEYYNLDAIKGKISHKRAVNKAKTEYAEFNKTQKINSGFEKNVKALSKKLGQKSGVEDGYS